MDEEGRKRRKKRESVKRWRVLLDGVLQGNDDIRGGNFTEKKKKKKKKKTNPTFSCVSEALSFLSCL